MQKEAPTQTDSAFVIKFNGRSYTARDGQTIAEVLLLNGIRKFRRSASGQPRGAFCGVGTCYECRAFVNGMPNMRLCLTPATPECRVVSQEDDCIEEEK